MWWWVRIGAQYSKGLECCSGRSICFSSRNNCPGIWICFVVGWWFFFWSCCELSAVSRSLGKSAGCMFP